MPEFKSTEEEGERPGTTDQRARDKDAEHKQRSADGANKTTMESDVSEGDTFRLLMRQKENKLSATYDPEPYSVVSKRGDLMVIERGETLFKRNVGHVKKFIQPVAGESQQQREPTQQLEQGPPMDPVILTHPEPSPTAAEWPMSESTTDWLAPG